jgi:hypothetical protein
MVDLDDALAAARRRADEEARARAAIRENQRRQDAERADLLADAVRRLEPYGTETFAVIEPASRWRFARYWDTTGIRYRIRALCRCWVLGMVANGVPAERYGIEPLERPVLLLDNGSVGTFRCDPTIPDPPEGRYLASAPLEAFTAESWQPLWSIDSLRDKLAPVIVGYERGPRWHERYRD